MANIRLSMKHAGRNFKKTTNYTEYTKDGGIISTLYILKNKPPNVAELVSSSKRKQKVGDSGCAQKPPLHLGV
jgi:hypothetical protein